MVERVGQAVAVVVERVAPEPGDRREHDEDRRRHVASCTANGTRRAVLGRCGRRARRGPRSRRGTRQPQLAARRRARPCGAACARRRGRCASGTGARASRRRTRPSRRRARGRPAAGRSARARSRRAWPRTAPRRASAGRSGRRCPPGRAPRRRSGRCPAAPAAPSACPSHVALALARRRARSARRPPGWPSVGAQHADLASGTCSETTRTREGDRAARPGPVIHAPSGRRRTRSGAAAVVSSEIRGTSVAARPPRRSADAHAVDAVGRAAAGLRPCRPSSTRHGLPRAAGTAGGEPPHLVAVRVDDRRPSRRRRLRDPQRGSAPTSRRPSPLGEKWLRELL